MTVGTRTDPYGTFNFAVALLDAAGGERTVARFAECSGLEATLEVHEQLEGGVNDRVHKFPTRITYGTIALKRGVTADTTLRDWFAELQRGRPARRDGLVVLLDEAQRPVVGWRFERALPAKWTGPGLNATASEAAVESLELAVERIAPFAVGGAG